MVDDELFQVAVCIVRDAGSPSMPTLLLQRRLRISYARAAHLIDLMKKDGIIGPGGEVQKAAV